MQNNYMASQGSRFAEIEEIKQSLTKVFLGNKKNSVGGVPVLSDGKMLYVAGEDANTLVVADPGAGKSRRVAMPLIYADGAAGHSMIVNDPKGELSKASYDYLRKRGYSIHIISFRHPETGGQFNPLLYGSQLYKEGREDIASEVFMQFGESIYSKVHSDSDPFWEVMACNLFTGLCLIACREVPPEKVTLSLVYRIFLEGEKKIGGTTILKEYLSSTEDWLLEEALSGYVNAPSETKASILSIFTSVLSRLIINRSINDMLSASSFEPGEIVKKKTAVFIISKDESAVYNVLISAMIDQLYVRLIDIAENLGGTLDRRVDFILDEFSNFSKIPNFDTKISACRSRNIRMHLFVQSFEQLSHVYGTSIALVIIGCCSNTVFLHSPEEKVLELISKRCGTYVTEYTHEKRELLSTSELQHLSKEDGEALMLFGRNYPYITYLPDLSVYQEKLNISNPEFLELQIRDKVIQSDFSIKKLVETNRQKKIDELLGKNKKEEKHPIKLPPPFYGSAPMMEELISCIDAKIEELEKEENKED